MEVASVYNTNVDQYRYVIVCIINDSSIKLVETIVDTGAMRTCYMAHVIDPELTEDLLVNAPHIDIGGFVDKKSPKNSVRFYQYPVKQFTIGNINLGDQIIWITFDKRVSDNVLGLDILQHATFLQLADSNHLSFFENNTELANYVNSLTLST